ncbi:LAO/AO transport system kinase [Haloarcula quadrata]|jgi:LAO/AO transport system kinase|uniref:ArgK protein n=3 Tax=Haloarcula TaxID=2237 RepID=Q5V3J6_HALMA|nr:MULTISPECIES: methylmalonyl Co-A mutase-associated GTPase MeaB [Haloarcula]AAV45906.1 ArgK protein [Haloarcula marismortui ATCC 43049]EMA11914.1 ArgK protein [Haloarcula californiae ATCC 33799]NHN62017.1 methylmalonyl Co-A mutase-associated GTPase MeaB [Haloarcula sp. JP-Z28]NHX38266.1 methylmalonyl Co-A mutase-associated GTPase MeaB [Haloarcula sp. R1-2]QCP90678.1 methylmalonyl Co-A mutase-associated GTPase MeaB [Haloarcula marismortui ATCC 43049]
MSDLVADLLAGKHSALARVITLIENRSSGYREIISDLHQHTGTADVIGVTGSPGAGKSTLVDKVAATYREQGQTVGVIAIDPSSPFSGGAVLGDRIRMASNAGDMDMFFRSMSARGSLGGLSTATTDAVTALDAFGKDKIIVETVGAGQNEVDIVRTADTVAVLVPPGSGDDVQMLKAGILEIGDVFVVNKADLDGADRTVQQLREMLQGQSGRPDSGHHGATELAGDHGDASTDAADDEADESETWNPPIVETVANRGEGVEDFLDALANHGAYLDRTGRREGQARERFAAEIRTLLREDANELLVDELDRRGGIEQYVDAVIERHTDPYTVVDEVLEPLRECLDERRDGN